MLALAGILLRAAALPLALAPVVACKAEATAEAARPAPALELTGRVVDSANIFDAASERAMVDRLAAIENDTGAQFVVASTPSLGGLSIDNYSLNLANAWEIGDAERDDGVMILVAPNEQKARIEVGYGLETILPDRLCEEIMEEMIVGYGQGNMTAGTWTGLDRIEAVLREELKGRK